MRKRRSEVTNFNYNMNKFQRSEVQHGDYSEYYSVSYLEFAKRVDLNTMCGMFLPHTVKK